VADIEPVEIGPSLALGNVVSVSVLYMKKAIVTVLGMCCLASAVVHFPRLSNPSPLFPAYQPSKPTLEMEASPPSLLEVDTSYTQKDNDDLDERVELSTADSAALSFRSVPASAWAELPSFLQISVIPPPMVSFLLVSSYPDSLRSTGVVWAVPLQGQLQPYVLIQNLTRPVEMCYSKAERVLYVWELGEGKQGKVLHFWIEVQEQGKIVSKPLENRGWEQDCRMDYKGSFDVKNEQMAAICGAVVQNTPQNSNFPSKSFSLACDGTDLYLANPPTGQIYSLSQATGELKPIATIAFLHSILVLSAAESTLLLAISAWL